MSYPVAVITGAYRKPAFITAAALARRGYHVVLASRDITQAEKLAARLRVIGPQISAATVDVCSEQSVTRFYGWLDATSHTLDVLINNTAIFNSNELANSEVHAEKLLQAFDTIFLGAWRMSHPALHRMNARGYGRIVNVSSTAQIPPDSQSARSVERVSQTALAAITRLLAAEAEGDVKVNTVCPGPLAKDFNLEQLTDDVPAGIADVVWAAMLDASGPSGGLFHNGTLLRW